MQVLYGIVWIIELSDQFLLSTGKKRRSVRLTMATDFE